MKKVELTPEQIIYRKKIRRRKAILVLAFCIALAGMTWIAYDFSDESYVGKKSGYGEIPKRFWIFRRKAGI